MSLFDELDNTSRGSTAIGGQLNIYDSELKKYRLFLPLETLPSVVGSPNTVENDVTTSNAVGKIKGKMSIDDKDVQFLWTNDNIEALNKHLGEQCMFMVMYPNGSAWKFTSEYTYRPDDATSSDKVTGTVTFISSKVDDKATLNALDFVAKTVTITSELPVIQDIKNGSNFTTTVTASVSGATFEVVSDNSAITAKETSGTLTISTTSSSATTGIVRIKAKSVGMASWTYLITVNVLAE